MVEMLFPLCLSVGSAGVLLRFEKNMFLPTCFAAVAFDAAAFCMGRGRLSAEACLAAGLLAAALWTVLRGKRRWSDGLLVFCVGGSQLGLWTIFQSGMQTVCEEDIVLWLYCAFYQLHIPALLMTFDSFSLPKDWQLRANGTRSVQSIWVPALGLWLLLAVGAFAALPVSGDGAAVVKAVLATGSFWGVLAVMVLLVAFGQKREQNSAEIDYHNDMNEFMNVVRSQRHDYNLHVQTVASLISQEKWEECRSYVNALAQDTANMNAVLPIKDPAVAAMIHNFRAKAAREGISLRPDIRYDMANVVTSAYETNKIIGNLLQNAIDELSRQPGPGEIELSIFKRGGCCMVRVSNRIGDKDVFSRRQEDIFRQGYTTKRGHDGVGLSSIRALTQELGGDVTAWLENDVVHFTAAIPMRLAGTCREEGGESNGNASDGSPSAG